MAKKSKARRSKAKKKRKQAARRPQPQRTVARPVSEAEKEAPRVAAARRRAAPARVAEHKVDFAKEYSYVYADLKRVAIIAAAMLVILVALSFIIT